MQVFLGGGGSFCNEKCGSMENHSTENVHLLCCCGFKQRDVSICPQSDEHENEVFIWFISWVIEKFYQLAYHCHST